MINKQKIRLMTKLAIYDKNKGEKDKKILEFYKWDYIYKKNAINRIGAAIGFFILVFFYALKLIVIDENPIETIDYIAEAKFLGVLLMIVLIAVTVIGAFVYAKRYNEAQSRLKKYFSIMEKLEGEGHRKIYREE